VHESVGDEVGQPVQVPSPGIASNARATSAHSWIA